MSQVGYAYNMKVCIHRPAGSIGCTIYVCMHDICMYYVCLYRRAESTGSTIYVCMHDVCMYYVCIYVCMYAIRRAIRRADLYSAR